MSKKYDLIIFGATGYTGEWVVEECANLQKSNSDFKPFTWAVAGRSEGKLIETLSKVSKLTGVDVRNKDRILGDVRDYESLRQMAAQGSVIVNCVGPYEFYGEVVVRACLAEGASHVDMSGELQFLERIQMLYHKEAEDKGVYIVGACGFDSIPADCGVVYLQQKFQGEINSIECYAVADFHGKPIGAHFGTWQSEIHLLANLGELKKLSKKLYTVAFPTPKYTAPWKFPIHYSRMVNGWCVLFAGADARVIHRTQYYFYTKENQRPLVQYAAFMKMPSVRILVGTLILGFIMAVLSQFKFGRHLLENYPKVFSLGVASHEGPRREDADAVDFKFIMFAQGRGQPFKRATATEPCRPPNKKMKLVITGKNPGYRTTAAAMVQAALSILHEKDKMPSSGGVYSPGAAFSRTTIIDRLADRGLVFSIEE